MNYSYMVEMLSLRVFAFRMQALLLVVFLMEQRTFLKKQVINRLSGKQLNNSSLKFEATTMWRNSTPNGGSLIVNFIKRKASLAAKPFLILIVNFIKREASLPAKPPLKTKIAAENPTPPSGAGPRPHLLFGIGGGTPTPGCRHSARECSSGNGFYSQSILRRLSAV
jgi:hypothetical protein